MLGVGTLREGGVVRYTHTCEDAAWEKGNAPTKSPAMMTTTTLQWRVRAGVAMTGSAFLASQGARGGRPG